jgi:hypothetical protein
MHHALHYASERSIHLSNQFEIHKTRLIEHNESIIGTILYKLLYYHDAVSIKMGKQWKCSKVMLYFVCTDNSWTG